MQTIHRCLDILEYLSKREEPVLLKDLSKAVEMSTTSTHNFVKTLVNRGYVKQIGGRKGFMIGGKMLDLAEQFRFLPPNLADLAEPYINELSQLTGESIFLSVFENSSIKVIKSIFSKKALALGPIDHLQMPLHATSEGKTYLSGLSDRELSKWLASNKLEKITPNTINDQEELLAQLNLVRKNGYSINYQEFEIGACSIAAGIKNEYGKNIGSVLIGFPSVRQSKEVWEKYPKYVLDAAEKISKAINPSIDKFV